MRKLYFLVLLICGFSVNAQFFQGFENSLNFEDGFTVINGNFPQTWQIINNESYAHSGTNYASIYTYGDPITNDILITPAIMVTAGVSDRISFWYRTQSSISTKVKLGYGNSSINQFTVWLSSLPATNNQWQYKTVMLTEYIGQTVYVGFHASTSTAPGVSFQIDNIVNNGTPSSCALVAPTIAGNSLTTCVPNPTKTIHFTGLPEGNWILHRIGTSTGMYSGSGTTFDLTVSVANYEGQSLRFFVETLDGCVSPETPLLYLNHPYNVAPGYMPTTTVPIDVDSNGILNAGDKIKYQMHIQNTGQCPLTSNHINGYEPNPANPNLYFADGTRCANLPTIPGMETLIVEMFYTLTEADISAGSVFNYTYVTVNWTAAANILTMENTVVLSTLRLNNDTFESLKYYPNPVVDKLFFNSSDEIEEISVYTLSGQLLKTEKVNENEVDLSQLSTGIYIAKISAEGKSKSIRLVKI